MTRRWLSRLYQQAPRDAIDTLMVMCQALYWMLERENNLDVEQLLQQSLSAPQHASVFFWKKTRWLRGLTDQLSDWLVCLLTG